MSVELVPVGAVGLNDPVTPAGALPRLSVTAPLKFVRVEPLVSHRLPLEEAPRAYELFDRRQATKVVLVAEGSVSYRTS